jgi:hypothetical protein
MVTSYNKEAEVLSDALVDMIEVYFADDPINYKVVTIVLAQVHHSLWVKAAEKPARVVQGADLGEYVI